MKGVPLESHTTLMSDDQTRLLSPDQLTTAAYVERLDADLCGTRTGPYTIETILGRGGGGTVYQALHDDGTRYALKVLRPQPGAGAELLLRFSREIQTLRELVHPNIVRVVDSGTIASSWPYFAMDLLKGCTLRELLRHHHRLSPPECLEVVQPVVSALCAAHAVGIVHRDLKASNVFVVGDSGEVKLIDFGVAKPMQSDETSLNLTTYGTQIGTLDSMSPEQIRCEPVDPRTDIYALGVLMYQMLTGHLPFHGMTPEELMQAHLHEPPPRASWVAPVSAAIDDVIVRCLQKRPSHRYENVTSVLRALMDAVEGQAEVIDAATSSSSLAIYVEAIEGPAHADAHEDELDETMHEGLDGAREFLAGHGFATVLELGNTFVALHDSAQPVNAATLDALHSFLSRVPPTIALRAVLHADRAACDRGQLVGGPLAELHTWVPTPLAEVLHVTPSASEVLDRGILRREG